MSNTKYVIYLNFLNFLNRFLFIYLRHLLCSEYSNTCENSIKKRIEFFSAPLLAKFSDLFRGNVFGFLLMFSWTFPHYFVGQKLGLVSIVQCWENLNTSVFLLNLSSYTVCCAFCLFVWLWRHVAKPCQCITTSIHHHYRC